jgi:hypothetical protein
MKKLIHALDKQIPHKDRLALVLLFGVFAFTILMDLAWYAEASLARIN